VGWSNEKSLGVSTPKNQISPEAKETQTQTCAPKRQDLEHCHKKLYQRQPLLPLAGGKEAEVREAAYQQCTPEPEKDTAKEVSVNETFPLALSSNTNAFITTAKPTEMKEKTQEIFHCKALCTPDKSDTFLSGTIFVHERTSSAKGFESDSVRPSLPRSTETQHCRKMPREVEEEQDQKRPVSVLGTRKQSGTLTSTSQKSDEHSKSRLFSKTAEEVTLSSTQNTKRCLEVSLRNVQYLLSEDFASCENDAVGAPLTAHELESERKRSEPQTNIEPQLKKAVKNLNLGTIEWEESRTRVPKSAVKTWRSKMLYQSSRSVEIAIVILITLLGLKSMLLKPKNCSGKEAVLPSKQNFTAKQGRPQPEGEPSAAEFPAHQADVDYGGDMKRRKSRRVIHLFPTEDIFALENKLALSVDPKMRTSPQQKQEMTRDCGYRKNLSTLLMSKPSSSLCVLQ